MNSKFALTRNNVIKELKQIRIKYTVYQKKKMCYALLDYVP